jgi:hypothetical protein
MQMQVKGIVELVLYRCLLVCSLRPWFCACYVQHAEGCCAAVLLVTHLQKRCLAVLVSNCKGGVGGRERGAGGGGGGGV